jgi:hypothetical protein
MFKYYMEEEDLPYNILLVLDNRQTKDVIINTNQNQFTFMNINWRDILREQYDKYDYFELTLYNVSAPGTTTAQYRRIDGNPIRNDRFFNIFLLGGDLDIVQYFGDVNPVHRNEFLINMSVFGTNLTNPTLTINTLYDTNIPSLIY